MACVRARVFRTISVTVGVGERGCFVVVVAKLLLLLLHHYSAAAAALQPSSPPPPGTSYPASFTPQETQNFWVSEGAGNYTLGFKLVGAGDFLLSIWHSEDANQTAIWWADFGADHTSTVTKGATFNYTRSAVLQLYDPASTLVWQRGGNFSGSTSLEFLDTGNLRLLQENSTSVVWESFQDPRDSLMLVGLDDSMLTNNPYLLRSRRNQTSYPRGRFHMATFNGSHHRGQLFGLDALGNQYLYVGNISLNISGGKLVSLLSGHAAYVSVNPNLERLSLDYDADLRVYRWFSNNSTWAEVWNLLGYTESAQIQCRAQSPCGPFGICGVDSASRIRCSCPVGYEPISSDDPSKGCNSTRMPPGCGGHVSGSNTSIMVQQQEFVVYYIYNDLKRFGNITIDTCKQLCLNECACVASTYDGGVCYIKGNTSIGYLENGMSLATGGNTLFMKLLQLPIAAPAPETLPAKKRSRWIVPLIAVAATVGAVTLAVGVGLIIWARSSSKPNSILELWLGKVDDEALDVGLLKFRYRELVEATKNFSHLLGEGGYGKVYKGWLRKTRILLPEGPAASNEGNVVVAVKIQEKKQFQVEVGTLRKIHHVNLVRLLGYCVRGRGGEKTLLVFEYMEKGSLDRYLSPTHMQEPLPWSIRFSIAVGTARGIAYLHHDCKPQVLHCDIKPQNVLLDEDFTPKVADFGFAGRFYQQDQSHLSMSGMRGTRGYMAPEWLKSTRITDKVDVYSFGMLLLELLHGLNTAGNDHTLLIEWGFQCLAAKSILSDHHEPATVGNVADAGIVHMEGHTADEESNPADVDGESDRQQLLMLRVALWCVQHLPAHRPSMSHVLQLIEGGGNIDDPPNPADASVTYSNILFLNGLNTLNCSQKVSYSVMSGR